MSLAEGVSGRLAYKAYSTGVIASNTQPNSYSDPAISGGQILRRVSSSLKLGKDTYQSAEVSSHRQIQDFRHGIKKVSGGISGEFSPATYFDFLEATLRGTKSTSGAISSGNAALTSAACSNSGSTITFAGGDAVSVGFRIGDIVRFTGMSVTTNNSRNFLILGISGSNRVLTVYPAPDDQGADTSFSIATVGRSVYAPASGHVSRKFAIEQYFSDIDVTRLFTEYRIDGFNLQLPATGMATIDFTGMGRDMENYTGTDSPFFTAPAAETTTGICAAVNGLLTVAGTRVGVVTGLNIQAQLNGEGPAVVGQNFVPEVFLGRLSVTGQATVLFEDLTFSDYFTNETEVSILAYLTTTSAVNTPAVSVYLPRVKFGDADVPMQGEQSQTMTMPFTALKADGTTAGDEATTIRIVDTQV